MDNVVVDSDNVIQIILIGSLPTSSGVQCSKPPPQTGWRTSFIFPDWQRKKRRGWSKDIKGTITITSHLLLDIRLAVHYLSVQFSQPNMQARQIAPFISKSQLRSIAEDPSSLRMITTRHPFFRLEIIIHLTSNDVFNIQVVICVQGQIREVHNKLGLHKAERLASVYFRCELRSYKM